ncbi:hypothetical protein GCM10011363_30150 [Marivita lacus]|uniref:Uncharacterized protein n=1 Tax=Marivita lacus TaxID=1323742 RepID=A0ABQ1KX83_9RHOB|nr:hypothetical protein GCM10011363_30150 [Marivita lacus]
MRNLGPHAAQRAKKIGKHETLYMCNDHGGLTTRVAQCPKRLSPGGVQKPCSVRHPVRSH